MSDNAYWLANPLEPAHVAVLAPIRDGRHKGREGLAVVETGAGGDYQRSIEAISRADAAMRRGNVATARSAYAEAAAIQSAWVATLGDDKPRTRSVYAASVVALHFKACDYGKARQAGEEALSQPWLLGHSAARIREVLAALPVVRGPSGVAGA